MEEGGRVETIQTGSDPHHNSGTLLRRLARFVFDFRTEDQPPTLDEQLGHDNSYGFRIMGAQSAPAPIIGEGAEVVSASHGLTGRRSGEVPLWTGPSHPDAIAQLAEVDKALDAAQEVTDKPKL